MSQPPQEVYEARLHQLRRDIGDIDLQSFVLSFLAEMAEHEMKKGAERNSNGETIMEPDFNADEKIDHLRELLKTTGVPVAYQKFDGDYPELPYIILGIQKERESSNSDRKYNRHYLICVHTKEEYLQIIEGKTEHTLERNGYQIEKQYYLLDYGPDEHIILYYAGEPIISTHPPDRSSASEQRRP